MDKIDITMTATLRPEILRRTLSSFCENIFTDIERYRLIINIDQVGDKTKPKNIIKVCKLFFKDEQIVYRVSETPSFAGAVIWVWSQVKSPWVFHLEDDWKVVRPVNIDDMIRIMKKHSLASLRLDKDRTGKSKSTKKYGYVTYPKISLNPTLFTGSFIKNIAPLLDPRLNPEKQLRIGKGIEPRGKYLKKFKHGIYTKLSTRPMVIDIGRLWMRKSIYAKRTGFKKWSIK